MEWPCPNCDEVFKSIDGLLKHEREKHLKQPTITREQFHEEGHNQWVMYHGGWRLLVRQTDGHLEIVIRAQLENDPSLEDWEKALRTLNAFVKRERIGRFRQGPPRNGDPR